VSIVNRSGVRAPLSLIRAGVQAALENHGSRAGSVSVLLTDDVEVRELNRSFRSIDSATDVLTFPLDEVPGQRQLGDIAISMDTAKMQANKRGISLENEVATLAIHGALHLVGFDDEEEEDREAMILAMNGVSRQLGMPEDPNWTSLTYQDEVNV
jgi:rRNA maturation RNase YbeY